MFALFVIATDIHISAQLLKDMQEEVVGNNMVAHHTVVMELQEPL
jgi:hypothetical protein